MKTLQYIQIGRRIWYMMGYHLFMQHWKAAGNMSRRFDRLKFNRWYLFICKM